jgi:HEPN domain-containing protein
MDEEWEKYRDEAEAYCKTVNGMVTKRRNLGNAVLYNLIGLSLEAYLTAALMKNDFMPVHSSVGSMFRELKRYYEVPESFFRRKPLL